MAGMTTRENSRRLWSNTPFAMFLEGLMTKSESAQCTFIHRLLRAVSGDVLQVAYKYAEKEIRRRANTATDAGQHSTAKL